MGAGGQHPLGFGMAAGALATLPWLVRRTGPAPPIDAGGAFEGDLALHPATADLDADTWPGTDQR